MTQKSDALEDAVQYAASQGVLVVASAGNLTAASTGNDAPRYPAASSAVIGVGSVDSNAAVSSFSAQNSGVFLTAPGKDLWGPAISDDTAMTCKSGTSFSAPVVSAAAALALSAAPNLNRAGVIALLQQTAEDLGETGYDYAYGYGLVNIGLLLAAARGDSALIVSRASDQAFLSAYCIGLPEEKSVLAVGAGFDSGQMTGLAIFSGSIPESGILVIRGLHIPAVNSDFALSLLDSTTFSPLCEMKRECGP
jgi:subtilisin family serine protease